MDKGDNARGLYILVEGHHRQFVYAPVPTLEIFQYYLHAPHGGALLIRKNCLDLTRINGSHIVIYWIHITI